MSANQMMRDFRTLRVYQYSVALEDEIDKIAKHFPREEERRLKDQIIRATTSIPANIAEGNGHYYENRERFHLSVALGSSNEVIYWVDRAYRKGYINEVTRKRLTEKTEEIRRMLFGMLRKQDKKMA